MDEIDLHPLSVDLNSPDFVSDDYIDLIAQIEANQERLPDLSVVDGKVYTRTEPSQIHDVTEQSSWKLWVPKTLTTSLIESAHNPPSAAHGGIAKTLDRLKRMYYWPNMTTDVRDFVRRCDTCKETKAPNVTLKPPLGKQFPVEAPWQRIYTDLLGPYPRSKSGNVYLLIVLDHLSKFVLLKPLRRATSSLIIQFIEPEVFHLYGVPESLFTDNGSQFISKDFEAFLKRYGVRHITTATHSPQANASERVNRSILAAVRAYIGNDQRNWDVNISSIASALRSAVHQSTGYSPYFTVFGRQHIQHGSAYELLQRLDKLPVVDTNVLPPPDFQNLLYDQIKDRLRHAHENQERVYNTRSKTVSFKPGQEVFRRNFAQSDLKKMFNAKLANKFIKCRIARKVGDVMYEVEDLKGNTIPFKYHAKDLRL